MLLDRYQGKIKTPSELLLLIGAYPRSSKVVMCHGVFDIVHPGHIRHLLYAKELGDILIASITADRFITKGPYRPHVSQDLRALNLAAFELVDYVLIDDNESPVETIRLLKPDVYAKGFEYSSTARGTRTIAEQAVIEGYGGRVIFTPGDVVYSSTSLLAAHLPDLRYDKLQVVMQRAGISFELLKRTLHEMRDHRVYVVGDTIVDSYTYCSMIGGQTKTPTISARFDHRKDFVGGAAVVAKHLAAAGARVHLSTVLGEDDLGRLVVEDLTHFGVKLTACFEKNRPTTHKNAIVVGGYRLLKVDTLDNRSIQDVTLAKLSDAIAHAGSPTVVFADFRHGIFNQRTIPALIKALPLGVVKVADSQVASRWGNILDFKGFDLITPNEREARFSLGDQDSGIRPLASRLYDQAQCATLILKLGERGVLTCTSPEHEPVDSFIVLDSFAETVLDAVGAGDALLAYATLGMLASGNPAVATILGSFAAAVECELEGNIPIQVEQVLAKIEQAERQIA